MQTLRTMYTGFCQNNKEECAGLLPHEAERKQKWPAEHAPSTASGS